MGANTMRGVGRKWLQVRYWWEEYYLDNPIAWLWNRYARLETARQCNASLPILECVLQQDREGRDPEKVRELLAQLREKGGRGGWQRNYWGRHDPLWALGFWFVAILGLAVLYSLGWVGKGLASSLPAFVHFIPAGLLWLISLSYGSRLSFLFSWERRQGTALFLWLTRLTGRHILFGTITALLLRDRVRAYILFILPLGWVVGTCLVGDKVRGLWIAFVAIWVACTWALLWLLLVALITTSDRISAGKQLGLVMAIGTFSLMVFFLFLVLVYSQNYSFQALSASFARLNTSPAWGWWQLPVWWLSLLFPPIGMGGLVLVSHPLWGMLHGLIYLAIASLLLAPAIRSVERERLRPEMEVEPVEGQ